MIFKNSFVNVFFIFASKTGGVLVGVYFLPLFNKILGESIFGIVAVILSLQALLMMLDFGMSTLVARDTAICLKNNPLKIVNEASLVISIFYIFILFFVLIWWFFFDITISFILIVSTLIMFWILILQNISFSALLAKQQYKAVSIIQVFGVLWKALFTLFLLNEVSTTLDVFVFAQLFATLLNFIFLKKYSEGLFSKEYINSRKVNLDISSCIVLARRGKPLIILSIAGAAVLQLDKSIVTFFMSAKELVPYFLASSFCMLPIAVLAGPIKSYFQPKIVKFYGENDNISLQVCLKKYVIALASTVFFVTVVVWLLNDFIINLWLRGAGNTSDVVALTRILLPAISVGALGFIPYVFLIISEDYKFQANFSLALTFITLVLVTLFAYFNNLIMIAVVYFLYHFISTIGLWIRLFYIPKMKKTAMDSIKVCFLTLLFNSALMAVLLTLFNVVTK
ncbi:hypothetical protein EGC86_00755 [Shewanella frigidimarina]|uniref:hypothetical protein n=1 Tax=Shewanella frigidimarina TaxID=56812 RepID=UPI000F4E3F0E|nr:hypothetical protein [Shewanella frigidimarina]RPA63841.1 hypothetical protein EGC86_00755 [Shewanella frigidimarina]